MVMVMLMVVVQLASSSLCVLNGSAHILQVQLTHISQKDTALLPLCAFLLSFLSCLRGQRSGYYFYPLDPRDPARPAGRSKVTPWHRQWPKEETRWSSDRLSQR